MAALSATSRKREPLKNDFFHVVEHEFAST